jgi:hypothetical protein
MNVKDTLRSNKHMNTQNKNAYEIRLDVLNHAIGLELQNIELLREESRFTADKNKTDLKFSKEEFINDEFYKNVQKRAQDLYTFIERK